MSYIDDLCGPNHRKEKEKLIAEIEKIYRDRWLAEEAVSVEIENQLRRHLQGKVLPIPDADKWKDGAYAYHRLIVFKNAKRNAVRILKKHSPTKEVAQSGFIGNDFDAQQAWEVLIEGKKLLREFDTYDVTTVRGRVNQKDIEIWVARESSEYPYEDIAAKFGISEESARQVVYKVNAAIKQLAQKKKERGESGMYLIRTTSKYPNQREYLIRLYQNELVMYDDLIRELGITLYEQPENLKTTIDHLIKKFRERGDLDVADWVVAALFELEQKGDINDNLLHQLISYVNAKVN